MANSPFLESIRHVMRTKHVTAHTFRHSFAIQLLISPFDVE